MKLPLIKHINKFIEENDSDFVSESILLLEHISESKGIKDEELDAPLTVPAAVWERRLQQVIPPCVYKLTKNFL